MKQRANLKNNTRSIEQMNRTIEVECLGIGDMFGRDSESAMVLDFDGYTVALEAPFKINKYADTHSNDIDCVIWTHNDPDHIAGLSTFLFRSKWGSWQDIKPMIVSTTANVSAFWAANYLYMGIDRSDGMELALRSYANVLNVVYGRRVYITAKLQIEPFHRSNRHGPFDTMAFKLWYEDKCVIAYSGDTRFDPELIHWMYEGSDTHPIIHEAGGGSPVHTCISDLKNLDIDHSRLFVNHIHDLEFVLSEIEDCPIRLASELKEI